VSWCIFSKSLLTAADPLSSTIHDVRPDPHCRPLLRERLGVHGCHQHGQVMLEDELELSRCVRHVACASDTLYLTL
jgi:hypothetical protein